MQDKEQANQAEITSEMIEAAEAIFGDWLSENYGVIFEDGGLGDVASLLARFLRLSPFSRT